MVKVYPQPVPLVNEVDGSYSVCQEGLQFLERLDEDQTFGVVAVAGRYRSGKSFLLNRGLLEASARKGFATGNSINACTRGIWIYPTPLEGLKKQCFLVLDTEGTASMEASAEHDARLIGIALALASVFIFNSTGAIDEAALSDLATLTTVAQGISAQSDAFSPPALFWVLRDFSLELRGERGEELHPNEYLERALSEERYGKPGARTALKGFFQQRSLIPLVRPCLEESQLQKLNNLPCSALRPQFLSQLEGFRKAVRAAASSPKELGGLALNGSAIARLIKEAVSATNRGKAPVVQTIFDFLQERRTQEAKQEAIDELRRQVSILLPQLPLKDGLQLWTPGLPDFLSSLPEERGKVEQELEHESKSLRASLDLSNREASLRLIEERLHGVSQGRLTFSTTVSEYFRRIPEDLLEGSVVRLHEGACVTLTHQLSEQEAALAQARGELVESRHRSEREIELAAQLREELEQALLSTSASSGASEERSKEIEATLEETREDARQAMSLLMASRDELLQETRALASKLASQQRESESELASRAAQLEHLTAELQDGNRAAEELSQKLGSKSRTEEESFRASLEEMRLGFSAIVQRCEKRTSVETSQRDAALEECRSSERSLCEGRARTEREMEVLGEQREAFSREQEESKKKQTQELLQRKQLMTEAYAALVQDSQRCREVSATADRKLLVLEVERESLKRRVDVLELESEELRKLRRLYEEVRYRNASTEASLQASERVQEMRKAQLLTAEEEIQKLRASAQTRDLELLKRTAMLELQLQACGVDAR